MLSIFFLLLFYITLKSLFEWSKFFCRCNVTTPGDTYRQHCESMNYMLYIRSRNDFLSHHLKVSTHEKEILFGSHDAACLSRGVCPERRSQRYQPGDQHGHILFRPRHQAYLRHRGRCRPYRRREGLLQVLVRRPGHIQDGGLVVRGLHFPDRSRNHPALILPVTWRSIL